MDENVVFNVKTVRYASTQSIKFSRNFPSKCIRQQYRIPSEGFHISTGYIYNAHTLYIKYRCIPVLTHVPVVRPSDGSQTRCTLQHNSVVIIFVITCIRDGSSKVCTTLSKERLCVRGTRTYYFRKSQQIFRYRVVPFRRSTLTF